MVAHSTDANVRQSITRTGLSAAVLAGCLLLTVGAARTESAPPRTAHTSEFDAGYRFKAGHIAPEMLADVVAVQTIHVKLSESRGRSESGAVAGGSPCGGNTTMSYNEATAFQKGAVVNAMGGFAEDEIFAAEYDLSPGTFPITIRQVDFLIATIPFVSATSTDYELFIWDGSPDTSTGSIEVFSIGSFESPQLPSAELPAGGILGQAVLVRLVFDPADELIMIDNLSGQNSFSVGVRITHHNDPPQNPCDPIDEFSNAFPSVDTDGLEDADRNWLFLLSCLGSPCGSGWKTFAELPLICRPPGDWIIQAIYETPFGASMGACCDELGDCTDDVQCFLCDPTTSAFFGGMFCADFMCETPTGACCAFGTCLPSETASDCSDVSGTYLGANSSCGTIGPCCMPDGSCEMLFQNCCEAGGGTFAGGLSCDDADCPQPIGACCFAAVCSDGLPRINCEAGGTGIWVGPNTSCNPADPCTIGVTSSAPQDGSIDARQPTDPDGTNAAGWQSVLFTFDGDPAGVTPELLMVESFGGAPPDVDAVIPDGLNNDATVELNELIPVGAWTLMTHMPSSTGSCLGFQPADVDGNGTSGAHDLIAAMAALDGTSPRADHSVDANRDGAQTPHDLLRFIDLLGGGGGYAPHYGLSLPANGSCP